MKVSVVSGGGGHARLALGICQVLEKLKIEFNIFHTGSDLEKEWFNKYENYSMLRPTKPMEKISIAKILSAYIKGLKKSKNLGDFVISSGASLSFVISTIGKFKGKRIINFEVPDRIVNHSSTFKKLSKISYFDIISWKEQKIKKKSFVLDGIILPKPLTRPKKGKYILISTGTTKASRIVKQIVKKIKSTGEDYILVYHGKDITGKKVINRFVSQRKMEELISKAKVVISHPGYTAFESAVNYNKPVILTFIKEYKKGASLEDIKILSKKINIEYVKDISINLTKKLNKLPTPIKRNANHILFNHLNKILLNV